MQDDDRIPDAPDGFALEQGQADRGKQPPLRPKHVWAIRTKLQIEGRVRDLAMFNLAIDSKLRGCDVVAIRVEDIAASGYTADRATIRQKKTGRPVRFELSEQTRQAIDDYLKASDKRPGEFCSRVVVVPNQYDDPPICSPCFGVGWERRTGPEAVWDAFVATHKSNPDLPADRNLRPFSFCLGIPRSKAR
jgi:integrase